MRFALLSGAQHGRTGENALFDAQDWRRVVNDKIEVTVVEVRGRSVKLGFTFPEDATVLRKEIHEKVLHENIDAAQAGDAPEGVEFNSDKLTGGPVNPDG